MQDKEDSASQHFSGFSRIAESSGKQAPAKAELQILHPVKIEI